MQYLMLGLVVFLGVHSVRIFADDWRARTIARIGAHTWKLVYSVIALVGFGMIIWGFAQARAQPWQLWFPPVGMRHLASLLTLLAFILLAAAYVPGNAIKARLHHPMVLGVKVWALAHLLATGSMAHVLLFGSFLVWAVFDFTSARRRDRAAGTVYAPGRSIPTLVTLVVGGVAWAVFALWLHGWWIGIRPVG
jgi:uncharacterized membrane protein